jgi:hypothetical protein
MNQYTIQHIQQVVTAHTKYISRMIHFEIARLSRTTHTKDIEDQLVLMKDILQDCNNLQEEITTITPQLEDTIELSADNKPNQVLHIRAETLENLTRKVNCAELNGWTVTSIVQGPNDFHAEMKLL